MLGYAEKPLNQPVEFVIVIPSYQKRRPDVGREILPYDLGHGFHFSNAGNGKEETFSFYPTTTLSL